MRLWRALGFVIFGLCAIALVVRTARGASTQRSGDWTLSKSDQSGKVEFSLIERGHGGNSSHESDWPVKVFQGVDFSKPGRQGVHFTIARDAGKLDCEGYLKDGEGAGVFHFEPNPDYVRQMHALGFSVDEEEQYNMAVQDVSLEFATEMNGERLTELDTDKLVAFRIFNVNKQFIEELRRSSLNVYDSDKLVAFRIHGVTPQMIRTLHESGYNLDEDTLIAFRIHGVSPEFIGKIQGLGYQHPEADQLIAMRIHGVTPEYITALHSRGIQHPTIDDLVSMKIHGID
jgi:hypothetical protein